MKIHRVVQMLGATTSTGKLADDMYDLNYKDYYSKEQDRYIPISHMDFQHLVRAFVKQNEEDVRTDTQEGKIKEQAEFYDDVFEKYCKNKSRLISNQFHLKLNPLLLKKVEADLIRNYDEEIKKYDALIFVKKDCTKYLVVNRNSKKEDLKKFKDEIDLNALF